MHRQTKAQGFWGWVVLGLCALAVAAGAFSQWSMSGFKSCSMTMMPDTG